MITGTGHTVFVIPVHNLHQTFMLWFCIEDTASLPRYVTNTAHVVIPADLPVIGYGDLVEISRPAGNSRLPLIISKKEPIHRHDIFRKKAVILDHCCRAAETRLMERIAQVVTIGRIIIQK